MLTDAGIIGILIAHLGAFGTDKLKIATDKGFKFVYSLTLCRLGNFSYLMSYADVLRL